MVRQLDLNSPHYKELKGADPIYSTEPVYLSFQTAVVVYDVLFVVRTRRRTGITLLH